MTRSIMETHYLCAAPVLLVDLCLHVAAARLLGLEAELVQKGTVCW